LFAIFGATILALLSVLALSAAMGVEQNRQLDDVQGRLVPKAELGPRIEAELERLSRGMQDAVAAQDVLALEATVERRTALFELISRAGSAIDPASAAALRWAVQDYYETAREVSRRMIAGESGEGLVADVARMQAQQARASALVKKTTGLDRTELSQAFASLRGTNTNADRLRLGVTAVSVVLVALLAFMGGKSMLQALSDLSSGLQRFGKGDLSQPIPVTTHDELADVAREANQMASSLQALLQGRDADNWLKACLSGLSEELRGELDPREVAARSLTFLAGRVGALAGALYVREDDGSLVLSTSYAAPALAGKARSVERFGEGQGLVGQALVSGELQLIEELPSDYLTIQSGLGRTAPKQLVLLPLVHFGRKAGVLELALLEPLKPKAVEMLQAVRATLVISLDAARASAARQQLLTETQAQAERLTAQEEELRLNNQELSAQQEELRRANEELERQRQELGDQNQQLELARSVLQQKAEELNRVSAYKSQFLANMSHELRTPLNSMLLLSQLLSENDSGNLSPKQIEHLRTVHSAGRDLLGLINEVLDLSKIEAGKQEITLESVEPQHFIAYARRLFEATAAAKGVALVLEVGPDAPPRLTTDRQRVERILTNLLSNALKFTDHGEVTLGIGRPRGVVAGLVGERGVAFTVSDTGIGIPDAARERVFAPFEQVEGQASRGHTGTGLGLPIARESARLLGGELLLEESSAQGSRFVCVLPERPQSSAPRVATTPPVADDSGQLGPHDEHLLIIEDDRVLAEQLVEIAHARRLKVVVVATAEQGLAVARQGRTLGIILDVKLPDLDGWTVMERLKQDARTRDIPVHFVSGVDAPQRGLALGAIGYLIKPVSHTELAQVVRMLVPAKHSPRAVLVVEDDASQGTSVLALLEREGFAAQHVQTAGAALRALESHSFECMILDLGLPDMDGLGLLEALRKRPELGAPRVVIHTGRALSRQETRELEAYAEVVVLKDGSSSERLLEELRLFVRHVRDRAPQPLPLEPQRVDVSLMGIKLLLAEDDMRTVYSLSALLRSKGADVVTAETGKEALDLLGEHADIRGVLMDVMMPEMDGYEAMRRMRSDGRFDGLPVIALTAKAMPGERERCIEAGATAYLPKPVDADRLLFTLRGLLDAGGGQ
jgi:CheY-like chemotaxis protein